MKKTNKPKCLVCSTPMSFIFQKECFDYFRCPKCKHVTTLPYPTTKDIVKHYQKGFNDGNYLIARKYNAVHQQSMAKLVKIIEKYLSSQGKSFKNLSILDVGCFTGEFLIQLQGYGADVYGVELQDEAVKIANKKLKGRVIKADLMKEIKGLENKKFDVITLLGIVEHVTDPVKLIEKSAKLIKPGGILVIQTPSSSSSMATILAQHYPPYAPIEHIHLFSKNSLKQTLTRFDFEDIKFKKHVKSLTIAYVYDMFQTFGQEFHKFFAPLYKILPERIRNVKLPFYMGEIIVFSKFTEKK